MSWAAGDPARVWRRSCKRANASATPGTGRSASRASRSRSRRRRPTAATRVAHLATGRPESRAPRPRAVGTLQRDAGRTLAREPWLEWCVETDPLSSTVLTLDVWPAPDMSLVSRRAPLLSQLRAAGARLDHHGEFDWDGPGIHQALVRDAPSYRGATKLPGMKSPCTAANVPCGRSTPAGGRSPVPWPTRWHPPDAWFPRSSSSRSCSQACARSPAWEE
jgi:hypothetical protein